MTRIFAVLTAAVLALSALCESGIGLPAGAANLATNGGAVYHHSAHVVDIDGSRLTGSWPYYERWAVEALRLEQPGADVRYRACRPAEGCVHVYDMHRGRANPGMTYFGWYGGTTVLTEPVVTKFNLDYRWTAHSKAQGAMHELLTALGLTYRYLYWKGSALYLWLDPAASIRPATIDLDNLRRAY
jgi:hypothetical protein